MTDKKEEKSSLIKNGGKTAQIRSQSVTQKDIKSSTKIGLTKRSSSKTKGLSTEKNSQIPHPISNLGKDMVKD